MFTSIATSRSSAKRRTSPGERAKRSELERARRRGDHSREQELLIELEATEPKEPRWPHKLGDVLRRTGRNAEAAAAYDRAAERYAYSGFRERADAMRLVADGQRSEATSQSERGWLS